MIQKPPVVRPWSVSLALDLIDKALKSGTTTSTLRAAKTASSQSPRAKSPDLGQIPDIFQRFATSPMAMVVRGESASCLRASGNLQTQLGGASLALLIRVRLPKEASLSRLSYFKPLNRTCVSSHEPQRGDMPQSCHLKDTKAPDINMSVHVSRWPEPGKH